MIPVLTIVSIAVGILFLLLIQPFLFQMGFIPLLSVLSSEEWVNTSYTPSAYLILFISLLMLLVWYWMTWKLNQRFLSAKKVNQMTSVWGVFLTIPVFGAIISFPLFIKSGFEAVPWLVVFWILDVAILFWIPTAISTPGQLAYVVPGSRFLRRKLFGIDQE